MRKSTDMPRLHLIRSLLRAVALGVAFLACASVDASAQTGAAEGQKVTVLIYSGRPNPSFTLSASQAQRLRQLIAAARQDPSFQGRSVLPSILGYNGIIVIWSSGNAFAIYRNHIEIREQGMAPRFLADGGETEEFLLNAAVESKALDAEQLRFIRGNRPGATG